MHRQQGFVVTGKDIVAALEFIVIHAKLPQDGIWKSVWPATYAYRVSLGEGPFQPSIGILNCRVGNTGLLDDMP